MYKRNEDLLREVCVGGKKPQPESWRHSRRRKPVSFCLSLCSELTGQGMPSYHLGTRRAWESREDTALGQEQAIPRVQNLFSKTTGWAVLT